MNHISDVVNPQSVTLHIRNEKQNHLEKIINTQAFLSAIISNTNDMIWAVDRYYRITIFNKAFENYFVLRTGKRPYVGMPLEERLSDGELKRWKNFYSRSSKGLHFTVDEAIATPIKKFFYELSFNPIWEENDVIGISVFARDITARIKMENELAQRREQYQTLIDTMGEGLVYSDFSGKIIFVNKRLCQLLECSETDLIGKNGFALLAGKKSVDAVKTKFINRKKGITEEYEVLARAKSGKTIWVHVSASPVLGEKGKPIGAVATVLDITESKKNLDKLNLINKDLQTFIYRASHDLRAPLSSILGLINAGTILLKETASLEFLDKMKIVASRMDSLLTDLTSIARLEGDEIKVTKTELKKIVSEILDTLNHMEGYRDVKFTIISKQRRNFFSDQSVIYSILLNLISNSIKYRKKGIDDPWVKIIISPHKKGIKITISDNGTGIKPELQDKVYNMFFKGTEYSEGTGLGLYIVKLGVDKLKGEITLESEYGIGTRFTITLPCNVGEKPCNPA